MWRVEYLKSPRGCAIILSLCTIVSATVPLPPSLMSVFHLSDIRVELECTDGVCWRSVAVVYLLCVFCVRAVVLGFSSDFFPMVFFLWFFPGGCGPRPPKFSVLVGPSSVCLYVGVVILVL